MRDEKVERELDGSFTIETIQSLNEQLSDPSFKSSTRILILVLLALNRKLSCVELRAITGLGKGSLENHSERLERSGYVTTTNEKFVGGRGAPRQFVEITKKGMDDCHALLKSISSLEL